MTQASNFEKSDAHIADPEISASGSCSPTASESTLPVMLGRPDISATIRTIVDAINEHERTIVAACGPESLMKETRGVVGDLAANSGRSVTLHCEQFGW
jgi:ferredoxin-NADP reductase